MRFKAVCRSVSELCDAENHIAKASSSRFCTLKHIASLKFSIVVICASYFQSILCVERFSLLSKLLFPSFVTIDFSPRFIVHEHRVSLSFKSRVGK